MIYVNGDSWSVRTPYITDDDIWPKITTLQLDKMLTNESIGCGSNSRALNCLENFLIAGNRPELIIIALTGHNRWHLPAANFGHWNIGPVVVINEHTGLKDSYFHKWYLANSYNEIDSVYRYYKIIWNMHELCKKFDIPIIFFQAWDNDLAKFNLRTSDNIESFVLKYYESTNIYFEKYVTGFEFLRNQQVNWNYIESPSFKKLLHPSIHIDETGHPNSQGHMKIADFVYQNIIERNLI